MLMSELCLMFVQSFIRCNRLRRPWAEKDAREAKDKIVRYQTKSNKEYAIDETTLNESNQLQHSC